MSRAKVRLQIAVLTAKLVVLALCALALTCIALALTAYLVYITVNSEYKWFTVPVCAAMLAMVVHTARKTWATVRST